MKKLLVSIMIVTFFSSACDKGDAILEESPRTEVPGALKGTWMYGNFSMTEYWTQNPADYLGNALTFAIAFTFEANGTFTQYFTSSSVNLGATTFHQSLSKGTVVVDTNNKTITTYTRSAHYKRTKSNIVEEDRDLAKSEISGATVYHYETAVEPDGTKSVQLRIQGTNSPLTFLAKK